MDERHLIKTSKALADPTRLRILQAIATSGELCCGELASRFPIAQATVSHHVKILVEAGLVEVRREGQFHRFRALRAGIEDYHRSLASSLAEPAKKKRKKPAPARVGKNTRRS